MKYLIILATLCLAAVAASTSSPQRILGGQAAKIENYPFAVAILNTRNGVDYVVECSGVILSVRSVLTAAHCFYFTAARSWRVRVGSVNPNSGGNSRSVSQLINHPQYENNYKANDVGIMRISSTFPVGTAKVQLGRIAGRNYSVADNQAVKTFGWGSTSGSNSRSNELRFVNIRTVNQNVCRGNYNEIAMTVTENMMCAGILGQRGVGPCYGDYGGPLLHGSNNVVIGIASWSAGCGYQNHPTVFTRVPKYISWIQSNA